MRIGLVMLVVTGCGGDVGDARVVDAEKMALIPAGSFEMGCNERIDTDCEVDEIPSHTVSLGTYWIDETEVTQSAYDACVMAQACQPPPAEPEQCGWDPNQRGDFPVVCVTHDQARGYCAFAGKRLPTEAEWERAARGTDAARFPWGNGEATCQLANSSECGGELKPVGSLPRGASPEGLLDAAGNAFEWVSDWYGEDAYEASQRDDPTGPVIGTYRAIRGGAMVYEARYSRTSNRGADDPTAYRWALGFRCAMTE